MDIAPGEDLLIWRMSQTLVSFDGSEWEFVTFVNHVFMGGALRDIPKNGCEGD